MVLFGDIGVSEDCLTTYVPHRNHSRLAIGRVDFGHNDFVC
jgi:hypothetical protein